MENASYSRIRLETSPYSSKLGIGELVCSVTLPAVPSRRLVAAVLVEAKLSSTLPTLLSSYEPTLSRPSAPFSFASHWCSGILSAVYVLGLLACLVLGKVLGPDVFDRSPPAAVETTSLNVTWSGVISGMERWHQVIQRKRQIEKIAKQSGKYPMDKSKSRKERTKQRRLCARFDQMFLESVVHTSVCADL